MADGSPLDLSKYGVKVPLMPRLRPGDNAAAVKPLDLSKYGKPVPVPQGGTSGVPSTIPPSGIPAPPAPIPSAAAPPPQPVPSATPVTPPTPQVTTPVPTPQKPAISTVPNVTTPPASVTPRAPGPSIGTAAGAAVSGPKPPSPVSPFVVGNPAGGPQNKPLDAAAALKTGQAVLDGVGRGAEYATKSIGKTVQTVTGGTPSYEPPPDGAILPSDWHDAEKVGQFLGFQIGQAAPAGVATAGALGVASWLFGPEVGALGTAVAGGMALGAVGFAQTLGPIYAQNLATGMSKQEAFDKAFEQASKSGALGAISGGLFAIAPFKSALANIFLQSAAVQPAVTVTARIAENTAAGKDPLDGVGADYVQTALGTLIPITAFHGVMTVLAGKPPAPTSSREEIDAFLAKAQAAQAGDKSPADVKTRQREIFAAELKKEGWSDADAEALLRRTFGEPESAQPSAPPAALPAPHGPETGAPAQAAPEPPQAPPSVPEAPSKGPEAPSKAPNAATTPLDLSKYGKPVPGTGVRTEPIPVTHPDDIARAGTVVNPEPTPAQADAGNYQKGHVTVPGLEGFPVSIETAAGGVRRGVTDQGAPWEVNMPAAYGYFRRTAGADGDHVDVFLGPEPQSGRAFIINQKDVAGKFDEIKVVLGARDAAQARDLYLKSFKDGFGERIFGGIHEIPLPDLKTFLRTPGAAEKPYAPPAAPTLRIYRGEGGIGPGLGSGGSAEGGKWFTTDLERAKRYAGPNGRVVYMDINPNSVADMRHFGMVEGQPDEYVALSPEILRRAKPLVDEAVAKITPVPAKVAEAADVAAQGGGVPIASWHGEAHALEPERTKEALDDPQVKAALAKPHTVDHGQHIKYLAGYSNDGSVIYIDKDVPTVLRVRTLDGKLGRMDPTPFLVLHERVEKALIDVRGYSYQGAHQIAVGAEHAALEAAGWDPRSYEAALEKVKPGIVAKDLAAAPADLDMTPYRDTGVAIPAKMADEETPRPGFTPTQLRELLNDEQEQVINMWHAAKEPLPANVSEHYRATMAGYARELDRIGIWQARTEDEAREILFSKRDQRVKPTKPEVVEGSATTIEGTAKRIAPSKAGPSAKPTDVLRAIISAGGIKDTGAASKGDLRSIGAYKRPGLINNRAGRPLDTVREHLAQLGYFDHIYGNPKASSEQSTVADVVDLIDRSLRGERIYPTEQQPLVADQAERATAEKAQAQAERAVDDALAEGGLADDPALRSAAMDILAREGGDPVDAIERAAIQLYNEEATPAESAKAHDAVPGWEVPAAEPAATHETGVGRAGAGSRAVSQTVSRGGQDETRPSVEATEAGQQTVLPGAERNAAGLAKQRAAAPLKPKVEQKLGAGGPLFAHEEDSRQGDLLAPKRSAMAGTARQTETSAFRAWFGDSKVVDAEGKPLVVYHGTARGGFDTFDVYGSNYGLMGQGGYFTENPTVASEYTDKGIVKMQRKGETISPSVYPVYLSIKNPINMDAPPDLATWARTYKEYVSAEDFAGLTTNEQAYRAVEDALASEEIPKYEGAEVMQDGLRHMGYDGLTHVGGGRVDAASVRHRVWVAFDSEQIKSAIGNRGTFSSTDARISAMAKPKSASTALPVARSESDAIENNVNAIITRILGKGRVKVVTHRQIGMLRGAQDFAQMATAAKASGATFNDTVGGFHDPATNARTTSVIHVALSDPAYDPLDVARHEPMHEIYKFMLSDAERAMLAKDAARGANSTQRRYAAQEFGTTPDDPLIMNWPDEELFAVGFQRFDKQYRKGDEVSGLHIAIRRLYRKLADMFGAVRRMLSRRGYTSVEDLYAAAARGDLSGRPSGEFAGQQRAAMAGVKRPAPAEPEAPPAKSSLRDLDDEMFSLRSNTQADRIDFRKGVQGAKKEIRASRLRYEPTPLYRYGEGDPTAKLTPSQQKFWDRFVAPDKTTEEALHAKAMRLASKAGLDESETNDLVSADYMHRMVKGKTAELDALLGGDFAGGVTGGKSARSLRQIASSMKQRVYYAAESPSGQRVVISNTDKGVYRWNNKQGTRIGDNDPELKPGSTVTIDGQSLTVKQAFTREIEQHTGTEYYKDPIIATKLNILHLQQVIRNLQFMKRLKSSDEFLGNFTTGINYAPPHGWVRVDAPGLHGYMHPKMGNIINDHLHGMQRFAEGSGAGAAALEKIEGINRLATASLFISPSAHLWNVWGHWFVARGWSWANPVAYPRLVHTGLRAAKSVVTHDKLYRDYLRSGSSLIGSRIVDYGFVEKALRNLGHEISRNRSFWRRVLGVPGHAMGSVIKGIYRTSSLLLWHGNDVFMMQQYLEQEAPKLFSKGAPRPEAIRKVEELIPRYRDRHAVMGSRILARFLQDPAWFQFMHYRLDQFGAYMATMRKIFARDSGLKDRWDGLGEVAALGLLWAVIVPALGFLATGLYQALTGDKSNKVEVPARGPLTPVEGAAKVATGDQNILQYFNTVFSHTLLNPVNVVWQTLEQIAGQEFATLAPNKQKGTTKELVTPFPFRRKGDASWTDEAERRLHVLGGNVPVVSIGQAAGTFGVPDEAMYQGLGLQLKPVEKPAPLTGGPRIIPSRPVTPPPRTVAKPRLQPAR